MLRHSGQLLGHLDGGNVASRQQRLAAELARLAADRDGQLRFARLRAAEEQQEPDQHREAQPLFS